MRRPYYKKSRGTWYCEIGRKQINLGKDREQAFAKYEQIMQEHRSPSTVQPSLDQLLYWTISSLDIGCVK